MRKLMVVMGLMMLLVVGMASAEMVDDFTGALGGIAGTTNEQGYSYVVDYGTSEVIANDTLYVTNSESYVQFDYVDGTLIEAKVLCDAGVCEFYVGNYSDWRRGFRVAFYPDEASNRIFFGSGHFSGYDTGIEVNTSKYYVIGLVFNYSNVSVDCYVDGVYFTTINTTYSFTGEELNFIDKYGFYQSSGISLYVDWVSTEGSRPCVANWTCSEYAECVSPANNVSCTNVTDVNSCGDVYAGDLSEFAVQACTYPSSSSGSGTRYLVDADGAIVGVSQNGGVVQMLDDNKKETPFLSIGGGSGFDIKAWFSNLFADIKALFVK